MPDPPTLEFFYDFSSPWTYLAVGRIQEIARRTGADLQWRPMLLGGVFKAIDGPVVPLLTWSDAKRRNTLHDIHRCAEIAGVPFSWPDQFPKLTLLPLRVACQLSGEPLAPYIERVFAAYWAEGLDIADPKVLGTLLGELGLDAEALVTGTRDPAIKQRLIDTTNEAVERGVFGAPAVFVGKDLLFWGHDRLHMVEKALGGWVPERG